MWVVGCWLAALGWLYHPASLNHQLKSGLSAASPSCSLRPNSQWLQSKSVCSVLLFLQLWEVSGILWPEEWAHLVNGGGSGEGGSCWGFLILGDPTLFIANTHRHLCRIELEERLRLKTESGSWRKTLGILTKRGRTQQGQVGIGIGSE